MGIPIIDCRGCIPAAIELKQSKKDQGSVYFVDKIEDRVISHAFYVPDESALEDMALNQSDNGFPQHPELTVGEVLQHGIKYF